MCDQRNEEQESLRKSFMMEGKRLKSESCFQTLFFTWIKRLLVYGNKVTLDQPAVPQMADGEHARDEFEVLERNIRGYETGSEGLRLVKSMMKAYARSILIIIITAAISTTISMLLPNITKMVIHYVQSDQKSVQTGVIFLVGIVLLKFTQNLAQSHMFYHFTLFGYNVNNGLSLCVFNKALKYPTLCSKQFQLSELINYSQVDAQRMTYLGSYMSAILFFPLQLGVGIFLMYRFIGVSFLAGIGIILLMAVFIWINSKLNARANARLLSAKDKRMKATTEIFNLIRFIKVNAWEKYFFKKLNRVRNEELGHIKRTSIYGVISVFFFWVTTPLILSTTFAVFVLRGELMTAEKAFTTIILFNILQFPIRALPESITQLTQIWVSLKRIGRFLYTTEIEDYYIVSQTRSPLNAIEIRNGSFYWDLEKKKEEEKKKSQNNRNNKKKFSIDTDSSPQRSVGCESPTNPSTPASPASPLKIRRKQSFPIKGDEKNEFMETISDTKSMISDTVSDNDIKQSLLSEVDYRNEVPRHRHKKAMKNVNIDIPKGKFTMVLGDIGSGKSSLLYSILAEMKPEPGHSPQVNINGSIALVVQKAWIMSCSVEDNILMTLPREEKRFEEAVHYACFKDDLKSMQQGEKTIVGERGTNVSGGQKARMGLARALYSNRDIYLFDDIISAVDVHVGNFIVRETVLNYLQDKTRVMVTHAIMYAKYADYIVVMKKGEVVEKGTYEQVRDSPYFKEIELLESKQAPMNDGQAIRQKKELLKRSMARQRSTSDHGVPPAKLTDKLVQQLMLPEDKQRGKVTWATYKIYIKLNGGWIFPAVLMFFMVCWLVLSTMANIQIERWCESPKDKIVDLWWFVGLSIGSAFFALFRGLTLTFSGINQGRIAHKKMIKGLLYASIPEFFDRVPVGRILNRVSKDLRELDESIGFAFGGCLVNIFVLLSNLLICVYASTPFILIPIAFFLFMSNYLKNYYLKAQRECVRLENISNSPIVSGFSETINGLPTIRAFGLEKEFIQRQSNLVNINKRNRLAREAMESWFSQRLAWLSYTINISAIAYCLLSQHNNGSMAGLLLAYAFTIDESVINVIYWLASLETKMISVERIANFMAIEPEAGYVEYTKKWNTRDEPANIIVNRGELKFDHFKLCYRAGLPPAIRNLTVTIKPGEKIGVVGRTGAGKSTITSSILRLVEPTAGAIYLDGKSIVDVPVKDLRSSITLIAQEPVLIEGTLRENLDPRGEHSDARLLETLSRCCLESVFAEREGLETKISDAGDNLSIGEKQLVCIARAILRDSKLVLIDEATANIDVKADALIQQTIRDCFREATVITIAHRLKTIMHSDRILVMSDGQVAEFDTPDKLLTSQNHFYRLYTQSQNNAIV